MRTRSQSRTMQPVELDVNIDFDEASRAWNSNKKRVGTEYSYVCGTRLANEKFCQCKPVYVYGSISQTGKCRRHWIQEDEEDKKTE